MGAQPWIRAQSGADRAAAQAPATDQGRPIGPANQPNANFLNNSSRKSAAIPALMSVSDLILNNSFYS
jgi:hypothetical protein